MAQRVWNNWCLWLKAEWNEDSGDGDTVAVSFNLPANAEGKQEFQIKGSAEWDAFVQAVLDIDHWRHGGKPWVDTLRSRFNEGG